MENAKNSQRHGRPWINVTCGLKVSLNRRLNTNERSTTPNTKKTACLQQRHSSPRVVKTTPKSCVCPETEWIRRTMGPLSRKTWQPCTSLSKIQVIKFKLKSAALNTEWIYTHERKSCEKETMGYPTIQWREEAKRGGAAKWAVHTSGKLRIAESDIFKISVTINITTATFFNLSKRNALVKMGELKLSKEIRSCSIRRIINIHSIQKFRTIHVQSSDWFWILRWALLRLCQSLTVCDLIWLQADMHTGLTSGPRIEIEKCQLRSASLLTPP